ncbi:AtpZ/AtpI family protein [Cupriavidus malaysiensis]|uniref:AtpZ/AtpI family protein n=1 Tax=Cupriavidus malaysiensis TaxID=367825 RepID=UPI000A05C55E|nr:AtpZ/AtpI family protein [Cupriavidus malaysiensis]
MSATQHDGAHAAGGPGGPGDADGAVDGAVDGGGGKGGAHGQGKDNGNGNGGERVAQRALARARQAARVPEPSLASRLAQIGVLGWTIVLPTVLALAAGRWLDRRLHTGVFFSAPLLMIGAAIGLWCAWRWMRRHGGEDGQ